MSERLTRIGLNKYLSWLGFCREIGWTRESIGKLADLWLEFHDENGELR